MAGRVSERDATASERAAVRAATLAIGVLVAQQIAGKATRDALFLSAYDVQRLPLMVTASSLLSAGAVLLFSRGMARFGPARAVPGAVGLCGALLIGEWGLSLVSPGAAAVVFYLHMAFFGAVLASGLWSLVNERFDPHAAKRYVGRIGMGASVGGVLGGLLATAAARFVSPPAMLALMALLSGLALLAVARVEPPAARPPRPAARPATDALQVLRASPYLRDLALFVAGAALVESVLDYLLASGVVRSGRSGPALMSFFAAYQTAVAFLGLALQAAFARRSLEALGLAGTAALKPAAAIVTGLAGAIAPGLAAGVAARGSFTVLHNSLFRSAYELLYTPLPEERKRPTKALVDVGADKLGAAAGGMLAAAAVAWLPGSSGRALFLLSLLLGVGLLLCCRRLHRGYVESLAESLRSGAVQLEPDEVVDSTTLYTITRATLTLEQEAALRRLAAGAARERGASWAETLGLSRASDPLLGRVAELRAADPARVRSALAAAEAADPALVGHVIPLLARNDVFLEALRWLRHAAPRATGQLVDALLDPERPAALRRRLPRVLRGCATQRAADGLLRGLEAEEFELRYECAAALQRITEHNAQLRVDALALQAAVQRELESWPGKLDEEAIARRLTHLFDLLAPLHERAPLRVALWALRSQGRLRGTAIEYLENVLPEAIRERLWQRLRLPASGSARRREAQELRRELVSAAPPTAPPEAD